MAAGDGGDQVVGQGDCHERGDEEYHQVVDGRHQFPVGACGAVTVLDALHGQGARGDPDEQSQESDRGTYPFRCGGEVACDEVPGGAVQRDAYSSTMAAEKESLLAADQSARDVAYQQSLPTLREGATAGLTAATLAGGTAFVLAVVARRREGKRLTEFSAQDWADIAGGAGMGFGKGGVRGLSIYALTNFTATSAAVASSIVTASFGIAEQANKLRRDEIDELAFIENAELVALEAAVRALSSFVGQATIPIPVLGAVIGTTIGTVMYKAVASSLSKREAALIERYLDEQRVLDEQLAAEYQEVLAQLDRGMSDYLGLLERAFSLDIQVALTGSIELAVELGVAVHEILDSEEKALAYFLD